MRSDSAAKLQVFFGGPPHELIGLPDDLQTWKIVRLAPRAYRGLLGAYVSVGRTTDRRAPYTCTCARGLPNHAHTQRGPLAAKFLHERL